MVGARRLMLAWQYRFGLLLYPLDDGVTAGQMGHRALIQPA